MQHLHAFILGDHDASGKHQGENVLDLGPADGTQHDDVFHQNEVGQGTYDLEHGDVAFLPTACAAHEGIRST